VHPSTTGAPDPVHAHYLNYSITGACYSLMLLLVKGVQNPWTSGDVSHGLHGASQCEAEYWLGFDRRL